MKHGVNLIVALFAEAQPLIAHFKLQRLSSSDGVSIYGNERLNLAVSGMGKAAAAAAVRSLHHQLDTGISAWLNIGVAGHGSMAISQGFLAHRIVDQSTTQSWYPMIVFEWDGHTDELMTVEEAETEYPEAIGYDMEAAGFYDEANRHSTVELTHCYKIVSDNPDVSVFELNGRKISGFVHDRVPQIRRIVDSLDDLAAEVAARTPTDALLEAFLARWRFSVTERHRLKRMLRKSNALGLDIKVDSDYFDIIRDAGSVLRTIENKVQSCRYI